MYNFSTPNLVSLASNIKRVYEIAKLGNHTVKIVPSENCKVEDIALLNSFYGFNKCDNPDMIVELCYDSVDVLLTFRTSDKLETLSQVNERLSKLDVEVSDGIHDGIISYFKKPLGELKLGVNDVCKIYSLAKTIAKLDNCMQIKLEHVAEAVQYRIFQDY